MLESFVVVDVETTGLSPDKNQVIEIGAAKIKNGEVVKTYQQLLSPIQPLTPKIVQLTGITDEMLQGQPSFQEIAEEFLTFLGEEPLLGHNVEFDYRFIKTEFARIDKVYEAKLIDSLTIARTLLPELESRSLESLCKYYGIQNERAHRALCDALATFELYQKMELEAGEGRESLFAPKPFYYRIRKEQPITSKQKNYLIDLLKYHKINKEMKIEDLTKRQASRVIDKIILEYGRIQ